MIVGNRSNDDSIRRVTIYDRLEVARDLIVKDRLEVARDLIVKGLPIRKEIKSNPSTNAPRNQYTFPLDPHCSDSDGCRVKIWAEPPTGESDKFGIITIDIAVSSGGHGTTERHIRMVDHWGEAQCQVIKKCGREWYWHAVELNVATNDLLFSIDPKWNATITIYDN
jgi:hypothetical protein